MAFPTIQTQSSGGDTAGTSHTVTLPSGIQTGDYLLIVFTSAGNGAATIPAGWTSAWNDTDFNAVRHVGCWRVADGSEGSSVSFTTANSVVSSYVAYRISDADTATAPAVGGKTLVSGSSANPSSLTSGFGAVDTLWIALVQWNAAQTVSSYPTNYSGGTTGSSSTGNVRTGVAYRQLNASSEDAGAFTMSGSITGVTRTIAIKPAAPTTIVNLTGVSAASSASTFGISVQKTLPGVAATMGVGSITPAVLVSILGVQGTAALGALIADTALRINLAGVQATGAVGTLTPAIGISLAGVGAVCEAGPLTLEVALALMGIEARAEAGTLTITDSWSQIATSIGGWSEAQSASGGWSEAPTGAGGWTEVG
jgi:hypothetical protein